MDRSYWMPSRPFPLNLQLFADGADPDAGNGEENDGVDGKEQESKDTGKTFSQADVSAIAAKEAKKAQEKLLKSLGLDPNGDPKSYKALLDKAKEHEDSKKTDLEKVQGSVGALTKERDEASARALAAERKAAALMSGVPADKVDRYIKLAESYMEGEEDDFEAAIKAALKDFPATPSDKKGSAGAGANPGAVGNKKPETNPGKIAAARRLEQDKRSREALKQYQGR